MKKLAATVFLGASLAAPAAAAQAVRVPTVRQARSAIHRADAYAFIGRCHHTRYSVICGVAHEIEARTEDGAAASAAIHLTDRVYWRRDHAVVSTLWESTVSVPV